MMTTREQYLQKIAELEALGKKVWAVNETGERNYTHGDQSWPYLAQPFGTGVSECSMYDILVEPYSPVGETFKREHDKSTWTVQFSVVETVGTQRTAYWIAIPAERKVTATITSRSSRELAVIATTNNLGPEVAKLLD